MLDAGVAILEDGGYDAFTIAAVCERAAVAPTAIYARTTSKDALFLAVYEHGIAAMLAEQEVFGDDDRWAGLSPAELIRSAVAEMVGISLRHQRFLGSIVLISAAHEEVARRGSRYAEISATASRGSCSAPATPSGTRDPEAAARACFGTVFATTIIRVAYGPAFATSSPVDDDTFVADLGETAVRYLLADAVGPEPPVARRSLVNPADPSAQKALAERIELPPSKTDASEPGDPAGVADPGVPHHRRRRDVSRARQLTGDAGRLDRGPAVLPAADRLPGHQSHPRPQGGLQTTRSASTAR